MKRWISVGIVLLLSVWTAAEEKAVTYPRKLSCMIALDETFEVTPRPGWTVYPQRELALRFWSLLVRGPEDRFSLQLNFFCDTKDLSQFDTPEKMRRIFRKTGIFRDSPRYSEGLSFRSGCKRICCAGDRFRLGKRCRCAAFP